MGQLVFAGSVADITHHPSYFRLVRLAFVADQDEKLDLIKTASWSTRRSGIKDVGCPQSEAFYEESEGPTRTSSGPLRVLWTPRWNTAEGNCHFFEYKDLLLEMSERGEFALTFRPHPLCLPHLLSTGELTKAEHDKYLERLEACPLARIDQHTDYLDAIRGHDVFVSDISSVLGDAALTGKPVIYTHRVDHFNKLGRFFAGGFYWVRDADELSSRLRALARGEDHLKEKRRKILEDFRRRQPPGSVERILSEIRRDRNEP
jgi:CDP-glycerol glycerophosphotransferase (TagB/SpsB family)